MLLNVTPMLVWSFSVNAFIGCLSRHVGGLPRILLNTFFWNVFSREMSALASCMHSRPCHSILASNHDPCVFRFLSLENPMVVPKILGNRKSWSPIIISSCVSSFSLGTGCWCRGSGKLLSLSAIMAGGPDGGAGGPGKSHFCLPS